MNIVETFVGKVLDITLAPVARQFGYVIFYNKNIEGLKKEAEDLEATREDVRRLVDAARDNNEEISEVVQLWKRRVEVIMKKAEEFIDKERQANTGCSQNSCPNLLLRYKLSRKAKKMALEVGELKGRGNFDKVATGQMRPDLSGPSLVVKEAFESRVSTINVIMEALADSTVYVIGLYGLGGVGKTTLANQVAHKTQEEKMFHKVLTVDVKQNYSIRDIQKQIAVKLGLEFGEQSESEDIRAGYLRLRLKQENSLLIVLDDIWERLDLEEVGILPTGEVNTQRKFILTSRRGDLLSRQMNCKPVIKVELLSEEEAWRLFKDKAAINEQSDGPALVSAATEVFQKCARLPIAIVTVASALRDEKIPEVWNDALEQLKNYSSPDSSITKEVYSSIKLSYNYLKREALKSTFLLSAMFSQDPLLTELFMYAMGLGFLEGVSNMKAAQDRLVARVSELKACSLLLDSFSKDRFTMHDVVRDVALSIAFEERHALVKRHGNADNWLEEYKPESCSAICFYKSDIDELPEELPGPKVEFFYLESKDPELNIPSSFFKGMQQVKVLSLSNVTFSSLHSSINLLNKLITLSLHSCTLEDIAFVEHLKELKILNLSKSTIKQLPREVGQLSCLKILNLSHCDQLEVIPPNILSNLTKLEELYMRDSFDKWEAEGLNEGKERASLDELKNLRLLRVLEIHIPDASVLPKELFAENSLERYKISIGRDDRFYFCEFSKVLTLVPDNNINIEYGVFRLFKGVEELTLENLNGEASFYHSHNTTQIFSELRAIKVRRCHQLKFLFSVSTLKILAALKRIEVSECKSLEEIVAFIGAENVEKGPAMNVIEFRQLQTLELNDLPALATDVCFNNKVAFPNLEILILTSINCKNIWDLSTPESSGTRWSKLQTIKVSNCDQLKSLFPVFMVGILSKLERIEVCNCQSLEEFVASANHENVKEGSVMDIIEFSQLRSLKLEVLPALTDSCFDNKMAFPKLESVELASVGWHNIWDVRPSIGTGTQVTEIVESSQMRAVCLSNLKTLKVKKCNSLLKLIPLHILKSLSNLEELQIEECASLEVIFDLGEFSDFKETRSFPLKTLHLKDLPELDSVCSNGSQVIIRFQSLRKLVIQNCNKWEADEEFFLHVEELCLHGKHAKMMWYGEFGACHFSNVKSLSLGGIYDRAATFPYGLFDGFLKLEKLQVSSSSFIVIFSSPERPLDNDAREVTSFKTLELSSMDELKHIWDGKCPLDPILQNLKALKVSFCERLINLGPSFVSLENLTELDVYYCREMVNLLTSSTAKTLVQLTSLKIAMCENMEEIITYAEGDVENQIDFVKLKTLELDGLASCKSFCGHNHNLNFPSLDEVTIEGCPKLRIFCPGILTTPLLKGVKADNYKIHWKSNLNKTIQELFEEDPVFANLDIEIDEYPELIDVWMGKRAPIRSLNSLTSLIMDNCGFLAYHAIPSYVLTSLIKLERLQVSNCDSVEVIFDLEGVNIDKEAQALQAIPLWMLTLDHLPNLKYVWNKDPQTIICFQHLEYMDAYECESLRSIFPASIAENRAKNRHPLLSEKVAFPELETLGLVSVGCHNIWDVHASIGTSTQITKVVESSQVKAVSFSNLKSLVVGKCNFLKLIPLHILKSLNNLEELQIEGCSSLEVIFDLGEFSDYKETHTFPLKTLQLKDLPKLKTVCSKGSQVIISFQSLQKLVIENCNKLDADEEVFLHVEELHLYSRHARMLWNGEFRAYNFSSMKFLSLSGINDRAATSPYILSYGFPKLEQLQVSYSSFLVMFSSPERPLDNDARKATSIKTLKLRSMKKLKHVWDGKCQLDPILQNLKALEVYFCDRLINLGPSFVSLENLTQLDVSYCHEMINLLTSSTAKTLVQLTSLKITNCKKMEEIITSAEGDVENEIVFVELKTLELDELASCKSFCCHTHPFKFPSLAEVTINECPKFRKFCPGILTTPLLKRARVGNHERSLESSLNKTIQELFEEGSLFGNAEVKIDEFPELIDVWMGKLATDSSFKGLTSLIMDKCGFLARHAIPSYALTSLINLKWLRVSNCDSVEVIFDLEGIDFKETQTLQAISLWGLKLDHLPNLKYVWNKDPQTIICFQHLRDMEAYECESLRCIFPASIAKGLINLGGLNIESCGVEVIVEEDHTQSSAIHLVFPMLRKLGLIKLPNLKNFYPQRHTVEWPQLRQMDVRQCEKLMIYGWEDPKIREKEAENQVENQYPLLSVKVVRNLTTLVLNQNHVKIIMNGEFQDDLFDSVSCLVLDSFNENEPSDLSNTVLERFPQLTELEVSHNCSRLTNLAPCFASFDNLQRLTVSHCHHLGYLFTTLIAKSLVNLWSLKIEDCQKMGEIVTNDDGDVEDTIVFKNLCFMKLIDLPMLKSFCSQPCAFEFPSLKYVTIRGCFEMKMFCPGVLVTPLLEEVGIEENEERWEGNLNDTLEQLFLEMEDKNSLEG